MKDWLWAFLCWVSRLRTRLVNAWVSSNKQEGMSYLQLVSIANASLTVGKKMNIMHVVKTKNTLGFIKITTIWKSLQKVGNQYQPSTTTGQDPVSSGPPWTKACKSLTPIVRGYQVQAPSRSPRNTVKTPKNWIFWKFIMYKEKSRNFGTPNLYFHGEMAIW